MSWRNNLASSVINEFCGNLLGGDGCEQITSFYLKLNLNAIYFNIIFFIWNNVYLFQIGSEFSILFMQCRWRCDIWRDSTVISDKDIFYSWNITFPLVIPLLLPYKLCGDKFPSLCDYTILSVKTLWSSWSRISCKSLVMVPHKLNFKASTFSLTL